MRTLLTVLALGLASGDGALIGAVPPGAGGDRFATRIDETVRADYRGETDRLRELAAAFAADTSSTALGAWAHYWRGFALQRRAFNLMNDEPRSLDARDDLRAASLEFARVESHAVLRADRAEAYAQSALRLAPEWHFLRDILMKQIADKRATLPP